MSPGVTTTVRTSKTTSERRHHEQRAEYSAQKGNDSRRMLVRAAGSGPFERRDDEY